MLFYFQYMYMQGDMVNHELRVTSCELRVTNQSLKARVKI